MSSAAAFTCAEEAIAAVVDFARVVLREVQLVARAGVRALLGVVLDKLLDVAQEELLVDKLVREKKADEEERVEVEGYLL